MSHMSHSTNIVTSPKKLLQIKNHSPASICTYLNKFTQIYSMPCKALSATKKAQLQREDCNCFMAHAVLCYHQGQDNPGQGRKPSLQTVCREVEKEYYLEKHQRITLNHNTLCNLVNGGRMRSEFNAEKSWL